MNNTTLHTLTQEDLQLFLHDYIIFSETNMWTSNSTIIRDLVFTLGASFHDKSSQQTFKFNSLFSHESFICDYYLKNGLTKLHMKNACNGFQS